MPAMIAILTVLVAPYVTAYSGLTTPKPTNMMALNSTAAQGTTAITLSFNSTEAPMLQSPSPSSSSLSPPLSPAQPSLTDKTPLPATAINRGIQARAASSYLASRAATGLQLKISKPALKPASSANDSGALGDSVNLDAALESQSDLQTAAGEHKKYILVKKKPKHKKIKMEVYKPKMKYKKIKMKVPVKKMKKKKVKGYLVKKEKHSY